MIDFSGIFFCEPKRLPYHYVTWHHAALRSIEMVPTTQIRPEYRRLSSLLLGRSVGFHDRYFTESNKLILKDNVIRLSVAGFALHLILIFITRSLAHSPALLSEIGTNYLNAISTPFNFILFYEVLTLIAALPASTTRSIANQFEIVSLIYIRDVFNDIAHLGGPLSVRSVSPQILPLFIDMWAGLAMFLLVALFQYVARRRVLLPGTEARQRGLERFISQKKIVAVGLTILLIGMALYNTGLFARHLVTVLTGGASVPIEHMTTFYNDLFTVMIFTDVLILILSLAVSGNYEMVFRNAAFVVSIILLRISLTEASPYNAPLALVAMAFSVFTVLLFNFHSNLQRNDPSA